MAGAIYNSAFVAFMNGDIDLLSDTIIAMLLDSTYVPSVDNDDFIADIVADEIAGGGYARQTLAGKTLTQDNANDRGEFDATDITNWGTTFTGARIIVYARNSGADATSQLLAFDDFGSDKDAPLDVVFDTEGLFALGNCP